MRNESLNLIKEINSLIDYFQKLGQWRWNYLTDAIQIIFHDISKVIDILDDENAKEILKEIIFYFVDRYLYALIKSKTPFWLKPFLSRIINYLCDSLSFLLLAIYKAIKSKITRDQFIKEISEVSTNRVKYIC